jgi:beta-glucosidase
VVPRYASELKSEAHQQLAKRIAHESIVLVKNEAFGGETRPVLPLDDNQTVAVVGPYAKDARLSGGGSAQCCPHYSVSAYQGISERLSGSGTVTDSWQSADVVIAVVGVSGEGEATERGTVTLEPPSGQNDLIRSILDAGKKCVVVMTGGTAATRDAWLDAPAVVVAWFPGEQQGYALAGILFGDVNPSGRLSSTWPDEASQLPQWNFPDNEVPYEDSDEGRGYRYYDKHDLKPCLAFGHGLSYTSFEYSNITVQPNPAYVGEEITVTVDIRNVGDRAGDEVAQLYVHEKSPDLPRPLKELRGFARVHLEPLDLKSVSFTLRERELAYFDDRAGTNRFVVQPDNYTIMVGPSSAKLPLQTTLTIQ